MREKILLLVILLAAAVLRVFIIVRDSVPFAYDMGRDLLWAKDIAFYHIPTLIGPAASIWGVYFGPLWFYFLSIPLLLSGGNPLSAVYATGSLIILSAILAFYLFKKYLGKTYTFILGILLLFNAANINNSTYSFPANITSILTVLILYFTFISIIKNPFFITPAFFFVGLMFHTEPAPAVVFTLILIFMLFYLKFYDPIRKPTSQSAWMNVNKWENFFKVFSLSSAFYSIPFLPHLLFEIRHGFIQTKSLITYFLGQNPSLSGQLPLLQRIPTRISTYIDFFKSSFSPQNEIFALCLILLLIFGIYKFIKNNEDRDLAFLLKINIYILALNFLISTFLISVEIKTWYLYGLIINIAFLVIFALLGWKSRIFTIVFLAIFLFVNLLSFSKNATIAQAKADPAQLANQLRVIDLIYKDAKSPFSVYIYTPSIYDLNYQYLFWWQGVKKNRGLPEDFAYLPNKPDYVRNKSRYFPNPKPANTVYLIIEKAPENEFYTSFDWQTNFTSFRIVWEKDINNAIKIQKRIPE